MPIANRTNVYLTGGYYFVKKNGSPTLYVTEIPVVIDAGVESQVANNFLVYTNAKVGLGAYQNSDASLLASMVVLAIALNKILLSPHSLYTLLSTQDLALLHSLLQKADFVKCYITEKVGFCRGKIKIFLIIPAGLPGIK
ncbi:MAG: hypothetical protein V7K35_20395 [Nostoc sp.]|uniref:hypothetical protein n=1 Tax=Nostoc sp. TaxID=1180 RepID=UPI002FF5A1B2